MKLYVRKNSPYWWCRDGDKRFSTGVPHLYPDNRQVRSPNEAQMEAHASASRAALAVREGVVSGSHAPLGALLWNAAGHCPTKTSLARAIEHLLDPHDWFHEAVTTETVGGMVKALREKGLTWATVNRHVAFLRSVYNKAAADGVRVAEVVKWPKGKEGEGPTRFLTEAEGMGLIQRLGTVGRCADVRDLAAVLYYTGMRLGEALELTWADYSPEPHTLRIWRPKTKNGAVVPVPFGLAQILNGRKRDRQGWGTTRIFPDPDVARRLRKALDQDPINDPELVKARGKAKIHTLRHSFATRMLAAGVPVAVIQHQLGHADIATTMRYARMVDATANEQVRKAWDGAEGASSCPRNIYDRAQLAAALAEHLWKEGCIDPYRTKASTERRIASVLAGWAEGER